MDWWTTADRFSIIIGIISFLPILGSWWILLNYRRRQQKLLTAIRQNPGDRPMALAISIGNTDISNQVRSQLEAEHQQMHLEPLHFPALAENNVREFVDKLRITRAKLIEMGVSKIHLFYMGPVTGALLVGDVFSNGSVSIYYHDRNTGHYQCWGPLSHPMSYE
jgi:hypothetical protein